MSAALIVIGVSGWYWNALAPRRAVQAVRLPPDMTFYRSENGGSVFPMFTQRGPYLDRWARSKDDVENTCRMLSVWFKSQGDPVDGQGTVRVSVVFVACSFELRRNGRTVYVSAFDRDRGAVPSGRPDGTAYIRVVT